jgi:hypothetical protein
MYWHRAKAWILWGSGGFAMVAGAIAAGASVVSVFSPGYRLALVPVSLIGVGAGVALLASSREQFRRASRHEHHLRTTLRTGPQASWKRNYRILKFRVSNITVPKVRLPKVGLPKVTVLRHLRATAIAAARWLGQRSRASVRAAGRSIDRFGASAARPLRAAGQKKEQFGASVRTSLRAAGRGVKAIGTSKVALRAAVMIVLGAAVVGPVWAFVPSRPSGPGTTAPIVRAPEASATGTALQTAGTKVPPMRGATVSIATERLSKAGLSLSGVIPVAGKPGAVVRSLPPEGATVTSGQRVVLFVGVTKERLRRDGG